MASDSRFKSGLFDLCQIKDYALSSFKDVFCLRAKRKVDPYHKILLYNLKFRVHKAPFREEVELRMVPEEETAMAEVRIWYKDILTDVNSRILILIQSSFKT